MSPVKGVEVDCYCPGKLSYLGKRDDDNRSPQVQDISDAKARPQMGQLMEEVAMGD